MSAEHSLAISLLINKDGEALRSVIQNLSIELNSPIPCKLKNYLLGSIAREHLMVQACYSRKYTLFLYFII